MNTRLSSHSEKTNGNNYYLYVVMRNTRELFFCVKKLITKRQEKRFYLIPLPHKQNYKTYKGVNHVGKKEGIQL